MCGIAGIAGLSPHSAAPQRAELRAMIERLHHRGPDGYGFYEDAHVGLAHARLSIIDLARRRPADPQRRPDGLGRLQRRDLQLHRAARGPRARAATASTPSPTPRSSSTSTSSTGDDFVAAPERPVRDRPVGRAPPAPGAGARPDRHPAALLHACTTGGWLFASEVKALFGRSRRAAPARPAGARRRSSPSGRRWRRRTVFEGVWRCPPGTSWCSRTAGCEVSATGTGASRERRRRGPPVAGGLRRRTARAAGRRRAPAAARGRAGRRVPERRARLVDHHDADQATSPTRRCAPSRSRSRTREFDESAYQQRAGPLSRHRTTRRCAARAADIGAAFPRAIWHAETPIVRTAPDAADAAVRARARRRATRWC